LNYDGGMAWIKQLEAEAIDSALEGCLLFLYGGRVHRKPNDPSAAVKDALMSYGEEEDFIEFFKQM
jgi:hypothetical protein